MGIIKKAVDRAADKAVDVVFGKPERSNGAQRDLRHEAEKKK